MTSENDVIENLESFSEIREFVTRVENHNSGNSILNYIPVGLFSYFYNVKTVYINSNSNLKEISQNSFKNGTKLESISLWGHAIKNIPAFAFKDCENLNVLELGSGLISSVDENAFDGIVNSLKNLNLNNNQLQPSSLENFPVLPKLETLYLQSNKLTSIPQNFLSSYPNLINLHLGYNDLYALEVFPSSVSKLRSLQIQNIKITALPANFFAPIPNLQYLYLDNNQLSNLEIEIPMYNLYTLSLSGNKFTQVPQSLFTQVPNITYLSLGSNPLKKLDNFPFLPKLQTLQLQNIQLAEVPESFFSLITNLYNLYLDSNLLTSFNIPFNLPKLQTLQINNNKFTTIPESLVQLTNLNYLSIGGNNFSSLQNYDVFPKLLTLSNLDISNSQITEIPPNFFSKVSNLYFLALSSNKLTNFEITTYIPNLRTLQLNYNKFTQIPLNFLSTTPNITFLNMDGNQLTTLKVFSNLNQIQNIWLDFFKFKFST